MFDFGLSSTDTLARAFFLPIQIRHLEVAESKPTPTEAVGLSGALTRHRQECLCYQLQRRGIISQHGFADNLNRGEALAEEVVVEFFEGEGVALFLL